MPQSSNHKSRRRTPWDNSMERTASQQFLYDAYGGLYQQRHPVLLETGEDALINSYMPEVCPHCQSEHIKRFGQTGNHIQRYRCLDCKKTFTPVTGTIFEGHKISIREWMDYTLNIFRYVSINADSWNNRNAFTTSRYWLEKIFLVLRAYYAEIEPFSGRVYLDETYYSVRSEDIKRTPEGARLRGISTNQLCIGVACTDDRILCVFEGNGRPSKRKTFKSFKDAIAPGSTLVHDKDNTHSILIEKLGLFSEAYDADEIELLPDKDNPLRRVNEVHARLKNFLYAHNSFNRDSLQGYLDLFSFAMNPPSDPLEKVDLLLNLSFKTSKTLRYRDLFSWKPRD